MLEYSIFSIPPHLHMMRHTYRCSGGKSATNICDYLLLRSTKLWQKKSFYDTSTALLLGQHKVQKCLVNCRKVPVSPRCSLLKLFIFYHSSSQQLFSVGLTHHYRSGCSDSVSEKACKNASRIKRGKIWTSLFAGLHEEHKAWCKTLEIQGWGHWTDKQHNSEIFRLI